MTTPLFRVGACALLAALFFLPRNGAAQIPGPVRPLGLESGSSESVDREGRPVWLAPRKQNSRVKRRLALSIRTETDSNPFKLKDKWRSEFDELMLPGERFEGFESSSDIVVTGLAKGRIAWRTGPFRTLRLTGEAEYSHYAKNGFASFVEVGASLDVSFAKGSETSVSASVTPDRFKNNYLIDEDAVLRTEPAYMTELEIEFAHAQQLARGVELTGTLARKLRRFDDPFRERDRKTLGGGLEMKLKVAERSSLHLAGQIERGQSQPDALLDRSYEEYGVRVEYTTRMGDWRPAVSAGYKSRRYTTDDTADLSRYNRRDSKSSLAAELRKPVAHGMSVFAFGRYDFKRSNRPGDPLDPEIVPYSRFRTGVGVSLNLR